MSKVFDKISKFSVSMINEESVQISPIFSKNRVRIFYKGINRNGTYISEEFANNLKDTLPYVPIKGIYNDDTKDFGSHGNKTDGKAYGIVPSNTDMNFAWEKHFDEDGIEREYACVDVFLWTELYNEAKEIDNKSQSMEIFNKSIEGFWDVIDDKYVYVFTKGCFLGLQVLGDDVEPCFEGAAFYSKVDSIKDLVDNVFSKRETKEDKGGKNIMPNKIKFESDVKSNFKEIFELINSKVEDEERVIEYSICDFNDEKIVAYNIKTGQLQTFSYSKAQQKQDEKTFVFELNSESVVDNVEGYFAMSNELDKLRGDFEKLTNDLKASKEHCSILNTDLKQQKNIVETLKFEKEDLLNYKQEQELKIKEELINKYSIKIDESDMVDIKKNINDYSITDLEKELSLIFCKKNENLFELENGDSNQGMFFSNQKDEDDDITNIFNAIKEHQKNK